MPDCMFACNMITGAGITDKFGANCQGGSVNRALKKLLPLLPCWRFTIIFRKSIIHAVPIWLPSKLINSTVNSLSGGILAYAVIYVAYTLAIVYYYGPLYLTTLKVLGCTSPDLVGLSYSLSSFLRFQNFRLRMPICSGCLWYIGGQENSWSNLLTPNRLPKIFTY